MEWSGVKRGGSMYITKTKAMLDRHYPPGPTSTTRVVRGGLYS